MSMSKRASKEAFVQGHSGSGLFEIICIATAPAVLLLITKLLSYNKNARKSRLGVAPEFALLVLPSVAQMMGPLAPAPVLGLLLAVAALLVVLNLSLLKRERSKVPLLAMRQALTAHRGGVMIITCIAILAVDFHSFPRRFAKAETFGTGLMDAGVGSIIATSAFAAGMKGAAGATNARTRSSGGRARRDWTRLGALAALGAGRALAIALLDYQTHVGEYGVHWNFFLTLAAVRALTLFLPRAAAGSPWASGILGLGVLGAHQGLLSLGGLSGLVHAATRGRDLLSANKEGVFSLPGYFALHLLGCACGAALEETAGPSSAVRAGQRRRVVALVTALWAAFLGAVAWAEPVSRRSCNAAYVFWMLALNAQSLAALAGATATLPTQPLPRLLQAVSDTMLPTFLVANLLTGAVNMAIDTMAVGDWAARVVVAAYMAAVVAAAAAVYQLTGKDDTGRGVSVGWRR